MIEVTETAIANVKEYMSQQRIDSAIRVNLMSGGCAGPSLGLAVDKENSNDHSIDFDGVNFIVDRGLVEQCGKIKVDFIEKSAGSCGCGDGRFVITSEKPLANTGGGCGCSCSSGSCG